MKLSKKNKFNKLCELCKKKCKQPEYAELLHCPNFSPIPRQLELNFKAKPKRRKKKKNENYRGKV